MTSYQRLESEAAGAFNRVMENELIHILPQQLEGPTLAANLGGLLIGEWRHANVTGFACVRRAGWLGIMKIVTLFIRPKHDSGTGMKALTADDDFIPARGPGRQRC